MRGAAVGIAVAMMLAGCKEPAGNRDVVATGAADAAVAGGDGGGGGGDSGTDAGQRAMVANANVLMISVDSLRFDMPWAGYPRDIAPRLTALEKTCVSYTRAYSVASHTAPSVSAMFFGKYPTELLRDGFSPRGSRRRTFRSCRS